MFRKIKFSLLLCTALIIILPKIVIAKTNGNCGDSGSNVTFVLDDNGVLTISGTGKIKDYSGFDGFYYDSDKIKEVVINEGVTYIGKNTFFKCTKLEKATLPSSVKTIAESAFDQCYSLTQVNFPNGLERIENYAFQAADLRSLEIPASLSYIGNSAISKGSLTSIKVSGENPTFDSRNNCNAIIETASNKLILGCVCSHIPSTVTEIGGGALGGISGLTSITIPSSVTSIGRGAFSGSGFTSITIPGNISVIPEHTFDRCESLKTITLSEGVRYIDAYAFDDCENLNSLKLPVSLSEIEENAFLRCQNITDIYYAGTEARWDKIIIWHENTVHPLESYRKTIAQLKQEGDLSSLSPLFNATVHYQAASTSGSATGGASVRKGTVLKNSSASFTVLTGLKTVAYKAPSKKTVKTVSIPASVKISGKTYKVVSISKDAFKGCSKLTAVTIGKNVGKIGAKAFYGCKKLKKVTFKTTKLTAGKVGSNAFKGIYKKAVIKSPKSKKKAYKKFLLKKGMKKTMTFK